jgi:hypothetical protein
MFWKPMTGVGLGKPTPKSFIKAILAMAMQRFSHVSLQMSNLMDFDVVESTIPYCQLRSAVIPGLCLLICFQYVLPS